MMALVSILVVHVRQLVSLVTYMLCAGKFATAKVVVAPKGTDAALLNAIQATRAQGLSVIQLLGNDDLNSVPYATHQLVNVDGEWTIKTI